MEKPAVELLRRPLEFEGAAHGVELGEDRVEDVQVEVVPQVDPHANGQRKEGPHDGAADVVERLGELPSRQHDAWVEDGQRSEGGISRGHLLRGTGH